MPELALDGNLDFDDRVCLLRCSPQITGGPFCWYVGIAPKSNVGKRIQDHFRQTSGCLYTETRKPLEVELVWPAPDRATEAYVFYAMVEGLPAAAVADGRLGGWTPTVPKPNQLPQLMLQDDTMMESKRLA